jgi:YHS domain-containing protein
MTFIVRILRYLFWVVIVSWGFRLLRRLVNNMAAEGAKAEPEPDVFVPQDSSARKLVRDPICGMHMAETIAIPLRNGNELLHFCSAECREKYVQGTQKLTANA